VQRIRKIVSLGLILIVIIGIIVAGIQINQSLEAIKNCEAQCFDIEQAIIGFDVTAATVPQRVIIVLKFVFRNPSFLSAYVVDLPFNVEVAGIEIASSVLCCLPLLVPGNSGTEATGIIQLPFTQIPSLALNVFKEYEKGGVIQFTVTGSVTFRTVILGVIVPFVPSITREFQKQGNYTGLL
jgi:hypothetical protein